MDATQALLTLMAGLAVAGPLLALRHPLSRTPFHPAVAFGVPYFLITAGPAIRYLLYGIEPYGIHLDMLGPALAVAAGAQAGILVGCMLANALPPRPRPYLLLRRPQLFRRVVGRVCLLALGLAAVSLAARWGDLALAGKLDLGAADSLWLRVHYASFFLLLATLPAVIVADQMIEQRPLPPLTRLVVVGFGLVCILQSERDVALVLLMIPISWLAVRTDAAPRRQGRSQARRFGVVHVGAAFAGAAALLAVMQWARSSGGLGLADQANAIASSAREEGVVQTSLQTILGLGSNLFVASRVVEWVPDEAPYEHGMTYVHTLVNLVPSFVLPEIRQESLLTWFKERYAPTSQSGYGFGMEAEAYLNFGLAGPLLVFALWAFFLCRLHAGYRALPGALLYRYLYTFFMPFSLYSIRGDSLMCVKGLLYSATAVWLLARLSGTTARARAA